MSLTDGCPTTGLQLAVCGAPARAPKPAESVTHAKIDHAQRPGSGVYVSTCPSHRPRFNVISKVERAAMASSAMLSVLLTHISQVDSAPLGEAPFHEKGKVR